MAWFVAKSLATLRDQVNKLAPNRSKASDGTVGDLAHQARDSDHNPDPFPGGEVRAMDITHDPAHGFDSWRFADMLQANKDHRIKYIISNGRISNPTVSGGAWRKYTGKNPHSHHVHISVLKGKANDPAPWDLSGDWNKNAGKPAPAVPKTLPVLLEGSRGDHVSLLQKKLKVDVVDGIFGPKTKKAVEAFQKTKGLVADGVVGRYTWEALGA